MLARQLAATLDLLSDKGATTILDVGGGHGQVAGELARRGHRVTVLASAPEAVAATLRPFIDSGAVKLLVGDLRRPPVARGDFDTIISYRLLAHAHDLTALVAGLAHAATRSVIVDYATTRSFNAVADLLFAAKKGVEKNTRPFLVLRDADVAAMFAASGLRAAGRRPQFFWPMALHRAHGSPALARALEAPAAALGLRARFGSPVIARFDHA